VLAQFFKAMLKGVLPAVLPAPFSWLLLTVGRVMAFVCNFLNFSSFYCTSSAQTSPTH
jgi:hypothetical protein